MDGTLKPQTLRRTNHQVAGKTPQLCLQLAGRAGRAARPNQGGAPGAEGPERPPAPQSGWPLHRKSAVSAPTMVLADLAQSSWSLFQRVQSARSCNGVVWIRCWFEMIRVQMDNFEASAAMSCFLSSEGRKTLHGALELVALTVHDSLKQSRAPRRKDQQARDAELETERIQQRMEMRINELVRGAAAISPPSKLPLIGRVFSF
jgi:hypothetical protein